jgi:hypothetical protein
MAGQRSREKTRQHREEGALRFPIHGCIRLSSIYGAGRSQIGTSTTF